MIARRQSCELILAVKSLGFQRTLGRRTIPPEMTLPMASHFGRKQEGILGYHFD